MIPALLVGIYVLRWPGLVIAALAVSGLAAVAGLVWYRRFDAIGWVVLANYVLWLVSGLIIGGVGFDSLIDPAFYNGVGRIFLYYLPLLAFCSLAVGRGHLRLVLGTALALAGVTGLLLIAWLFLRHPPHSIRHELTIWTTPFIGMLTSTTGAGTFAGAAWLFIEIQARRRQSWKLSAAGLPLLILMATTTSRQAVLAAFVTYALFIILERRWRLSVAWVGYGALVAGVIAFGQPGYVYKFHNLVSSNMMAMLGEAVHWSGPNNGQLASEEGAGDENERSASQSQSDNEAYEIKITDKRLRNSRTRLILWRRATARFASSPIVGIGFGRFNDADRQWAGLPGLVWLAVDGVRVFPDTHARQMDRPGGPGSAHNSYLNVLAETGLIGLGLLGALWVMMGLRLTTGFRLAQRDGDEHTAAYFQAARLLLVYVLLGAMVGHALAAPSLGAIVMTIAGVGIAYTRGDPENREVS